MYNILTVDDDQNNLFTLRTIIEENIQANIVEANSGETCLKHLITDTFDLIILDVQMPGMDGFETAKLIKSRKKTMNIPIIFLTAAYLSDEYKQKGFEVGAVDYLTKPIDDFLLINRIIIYLNIIERERNLNLKIQEMLEIKIEELRHSEERYSRLFQINNSVMLLSDPETGRIVDANPAASKLYGYSSKKLKTMTIYEVNILPHNTVLSEMQNAKHKNKNHFLSKHKLQNGTVIDVEIHCGPVAINRKTYLFSVITDITEKLLNEMLKKKLRDIDIINRSNISFQELLDKYLECFIDISGIDFCGIYMYESDTGSSKYKPSPNISDTFLRTIASHSYTAEIFDVLMSGSSYYIENIPDDDGIWSSLTCIPVTS